MRKLYVIVWCSQVGLVGSCLLLFMMMKIVIMVLLQQAQRFHQHRSSWNILCVCDKSIIIFCTALYLILSMIFDCVSMHVSSINLIAKNHHHHHRHQKWKLIKSKIQSNRPTTATITIFSQHPLLVLVVCFHARKKIWMVYELWFINNWLLELRFGEHNQFLCQQNWWMCPKWKAERHTHTHTFPFDYSTLKMRNACRCIVSISQNIIYHSRHFSSTEITMRIIKRNCFRLASGLLSLQNEVDPNS